MTILKNEKSINQKGKHIKEQSTQNYQVNDEKRVATRLNDEQVERDIEDDKFLAPDS